jgi:hypothetical protein
MRDYVIFSSGQPRPLSQTLHFCATAQLSPDNSALLTTWSPKMPELSEIHLYSKLINANCEGQIFRRVSRSSTFQKCPVPTIPWRYVIFQMFAASQDPLNRTRAASTFVRIFLLTFSNLFPIVFSHRHLKI